MGAHAPRISRRSLLQYGGFAATGGLVSLAFNQVWIPTLDASAAADVRILHAALYLENEAVTAYEAGARSGLLKGDVLSVAAAFMDDHKYHRDGIAGVLKSLGEVPAPAKPAYDFGRLQSADDILHLALRLETGAATAYRTLASTVVDTKAVLGFAAHVLCDEVRHQTVLRTVMKLPTH